MQSLIPTSRRPSLSLGLGLLLLLAAPMARAQFLTADDFFHSGAQFYISNNIPLAKDQVARGRQIFPNDEKLKKLEQLLQQQQQSQNSQSQQPQQQQQQSQSDQQKQEQSQKNQQQQQGSQSQSQKDQAREKQEPARKADEQKQDQEKQDQAAEEKAAQKADKQGSETNEVTDAKGAHPMTPQEAERLLNAQKGNEQYLAQKPREKSPPPNHVVKDW